MSATDTRIGRAVAEARSVEGLTQDELGQLLTPARPQTTISRWENGSVEFTVNDVLDLEQALNLPAGDLLGAAGGVFPPQSVITAIRSDPKLTEAQRSALVGIYRAITEI